MNHVRSRLRHLHVVHDLAILLASASTAKPVPNARKLATTMNLVQRHLNAQTVEEVMLHTAIYAMFIKRILTYNQLECPVVFPFLKLV